METLSPEQNYALEKFKKGENLFITGPGGSGKTKLIQHFMDYARQKKQNCQVCALTGCAALLLNCGARTIHSWSGIRIARGPKETIISNVVKSKKLSMNWKKIKVLIVDEISMMSQKIFEILDELGKTIRNSSLPFGGIQVIFTGDFFQLPPVGTAGEEETEKFCFESPIWYKTFTIENHIQLTTIFRQTDPLYIHILSQIRKGYLDKENIDVLEKYVKREYDESKYDGITPTKLFPIRKKTECVNSMMFEKIQEDEYEFEYAIKKDCKTILDSGQPIPWEKLYLCQKLSEKEKDQEVERLLNNTPCHRQLKLKKGASVICTVNIDMDNSICNGSQGKILDIVENGMTTQIIVKFLNGIIKKINPHYWQSEDYPTIAVGQYPLELSWALTIHKIQGATLAMAEIDIGFSVFEYGQTYVALSRIQSLDGLYLSAFDPKKIYANPKVIEFYNSIPEVPNVSISESNIFKDFEYKEETSTKFENNVKIIKI